MQSGGTDVGSQVDMHTCTEACTYSKQGVGSVKGDWDMHVWPHTGAHVCMQLCKGVGADMVRHTYKHTNQDVDLKRVTGPCMKSHTGAHLFHVTK